MSFNENMNFKELINLFLKNNGFNEYHKAIFSFHSKKINRNIVKQLKELGIKDNSVIEVKKQNLLNITNNNGNMGNITIPQNNYAFMSTNMINNNENMGNITIPQNNYAFMSTNMINNYGNMGNITIPQNNYAFMSTNMINNNGNMGNITIPQNNYAFMSTNMINNKYIINMAQNMDNNSAMKICDDNSYFYNIIFNFSGSRYSIQGLKNNKFCEVATKFIHKACLGDYFPLFISNSHRIDFSDTHTLEELGFRNFSSIEVISSNVIGA